MKFKIIACVLASSLALLSPGQRVSAASTGSDGVTWWVDFSHQELKDASALSEAMPSSSPYSKAARVVLAVLQAADQAGGNRGASVVGLTMFSQLIVVPKPYRSNVSKQTATIPNDATDFAKDMLDIVFKGNIPNIEITWPPKDEEDYGRIEYAGKPEAYEKFQIINKDGELNGLLFHTGFLSDRGGEKLLANRRKLERYEQWQIVRCYDGLVALRSRKTTGHYYASSQSNLAKVIPIGEENRDGNVPKLTMWRELFRLEALGDGFYALATLDRNQKRTGSYFSARP